MTVLRVRGFKIFKDRHGKQRCYHRATGLSIDTEKNPIGSIEFISECNRVSEKIKQVKPKVGTLGQLIVDYKNSYTFQNLADNTRRDYQRVLQYLKEIEDIPLSKFNPALVVKIRDKTFSTKKRRFANYVKTVLSILFSWGRERGYINFNPAEKIKDIKPSKDAPRANRPWTDEECETILLEAEPHIRLPVAIMMHMAIGPKETFQLLKSAIRNNSINLERSKTKEAVFWRMPERLQQVLNETPTHNCITVCANSFGTPWTISGFNSSWQKFKARLYKEGKIGPHLTLYGLRHTVAKVMREMGYDERTIADALGQKTTQMARHYSRGADLEKKMIPVGAALDAEWNKRRTKVVKP